MFIRAERNPRCVQYKGYNARQILPTWAYCLPSLASSAQKLRQSSTSGCQWPEFGRAYKTFITNPHKKKSGGVRTGERGGQAPIIAEGVVQEITGVMVMHLTRKRQYSRLHLAVVPSCSCSILLYGARPSPEGGYGDRPPCNTPIRTKRFLSDLRFTISLVTREFLVSHVITSRAFTLPMTARRLARARTTAKKITISVCLQL